MATELVSRGPVDGEVAASIVVQSTPCPFEDGSVTITFGPDSDGSTIARGAAVMAFCLQGGALVSTDHFDTKPAPVDLSSAVEARDLLLALCGSRSNSTGSSTFSGLIPVMDTRLVDWHSVHMAHATATTTEIPRPMSFDAGTDIFGETAIVRAS